MMISAETLESLIVQDILEQDNNEVDGTSDDRLESLRRQFKHD